MAPSRRRVNEKGFHLQVGAFFYLPLSMLTKNQNIRHFFFLGLLLFVTVLFYGLVQPFLMATFWATVLAITFNRSYRVIRVKLKGKSNTAAVLTVLVVVLIVVVPLLFVLLALVDQGEQVVRKIQTGEWNVAFIADYIEVKTPRIESWLSSVGVTPDRIRSDISSFAAKAANIIADQAVSYTQDAITMTASFMLMLYMLYFMLRDGREIIQSIMDAVPMGNRKEQVLVNRFTSIVRATLKGTVIVAIIQGALGGIIFALLGIEGALFWGVIMTLLSFLPIGGSAIIWAPMAIILLVEGAIIKGIILILVGSLVIGLVDNILRPMLVGRDTKLPDYLILIATLGGIGMFGLSGFVIGPVIAGLFVTCWQMAGTNYGGTAS